VVSFDGEDAVMRNDVFCFICGCTEFANKTIDYRKCLSCGHEILLSSGDQGFIINDVLSEKEVRRLAGLDHFKIQASLYFDTNIDKKLLLDIGSASGKFLLHNAWRYERAIGIEITPESMFFSREVLGLEIVREIGEVSDNVSFATAWHSLEHIPQEDLCLLIEVLFQKMSLGGRFLVSVPNSASWQYQWFGRKFAYYDVPNHLHQFTPNTLAQLMQRYGFNYVATINSWEYNTFGYTQSLLNALTNTHNYLYYRLKRKNLKPSIGLDIANGLLLAICVPFGWLFGLIDAMNLKRQGVITACFQKNTC
jgi:hypothetical protein